MQLMLHLAVFMVLCRCQWVWWKFRATPVFKEIEKVKATEKERDKRKKKGDDKRRQDANRANKSP